MSRARYERLLAEHPRPWCWACGRGAGDVPRDWAAPWCIERAHIVNKPRVLDRRAVVLLCSACHRQQHGDRLMVDGRQYWPPLERAHLLWLKRGSDPEWFDLSFLARYALGALPAPAAPPLCYRTELAARRWAEVSRDG